MRTLWSIPVSGITLQDPARCKNATPSIRHPDVTWSCRRGSKSDQTTVSANPRNAHAPEEPRVGIMVMSEQLRLGGDENHVCRMMPAVGRKVPAPSAQRLSVVPAVNLGLAEY